MGLVAARCGAWRCSQRAGCVRPRSLRLPLDRDRRATSPSTVFRPPVVLVSFSFSFSRALVLVLVLVVLSSSSRATPSAARERHHTNEGARGAPAGRTNAVSELPRASRERTACLSERAASTRHRGRVSFACMMQMTSTTRRADVGVCRTLVVRGDAQRPTLRTVSSRVVRLVGHVSSGLSDSGVRTADRLARTSSQKWRCRGGRISRKCLEVGGFIEKSRRIGALGWHEVGHSRGKNAKSK